MRGAHEKHTSADNGTYTLMLIVSDARGGKDTASATVTIANVPPTILPCSLTGPSVPIALTSGSASAPISFTFDDPAGRNDVYRAEIACGNGVVLAPTNILLGGYATQGPYTDACPYTAAGVYAVRVVVAASRPIVATAVGGVRDAVRNGDTGLLVLPRDDAALAGAIGALPADPSRTCAMGAAGVRRARSEFHASVVIDSLEHLYDDLLARAH